MGWISLPNLLTDSHPGRRIAHAPELQHAGWREQCLRAAAGLRAREVRRAGLWFEDAVQLSMALMACWRAGVHAVLASDARAPTCALLDGELDLWLSDTDLPLPSGRQTSLAALARAAPLPAQALDPDGVEVVLCTSGSSGEPKRIAKRWRQLADEVQALEQRWHWAGSDACVLGSVSAQHMYGLPFRVLWPLCAGRTIERMQWVFPENIFQASASHAACIWIASPALLKRLGDQLDWEALRGRVRAVFSSGGPLPAASADQLRLRLGLAATEIYGSSETGAVASRQRQQAWRTLSGVQTGVNEAGALWVRSPWNRDGGLEQTADAVTLHDEGFELLGRLDRIVKLEEKRIALPRVEQVLADSELVAEAHVGQAFGEPRLTALVALTPRGVAAYRAQGRVALTRCLRDHLLHSLDSLAVPRRWRFVQTLPWNGQGKLPRHAFEQSAGPRPVLPRVLGIAPAPAAAEANALADADADERIVAEVIVPLDLAHFSGHFPCVPIVPGVAQIGWAMEFARRHIDASLRCHGLEAVKFQRLVRPGDALTLTLWLRRDRGKLVFSFHGDGLSCSSGRILVGAAA